MANVTNFKKYGYFHGLDGTPDRAAMIIFCQRRAGDIIKAFGSTLTHNELMARIYYQGLMDGLDIFGAAKSEEGKQIVDEKKEHRCCI